MKKLLIIIAALIPIIIGISGCYIFTAVLLPLFQYGKEAGIAIGIYTVHYILIFIPVVVAVESFSAYYVLTSLRNYRYKLWAFILYLLFPIFLIVMPFFVEKLLHDYFKEKIQTQKFQQQKTQEEEIKIKGSKHVKPQTP